ncbi:GNAT family N-acetyltransferase [Nostocoides sp. F2B08]|uniref:GNAT family N-acetyltransferase n=1 Tax=Nostocoides sp. F2B08 TaxID=2653936 RepID=UPI00186AD017|nr:GNAT family N-acetyltransferase [Tetrasphaera sp. F2B08]
MEDEAATITDQTTAYPLRTERLVLRPVREGDIDPLTAYRNDPQVAALQDWELPYPRERAERLVAEHAGRVDITPGTGTQIGIERDGRLIGDVYVGLHEHGGVAEMGFTLAKEHQGQGYAVEAVSAVVADLVGRLGVHRVFAQLSPLNEASARVLERAGFEFESLAPRSFWWRGTWDDNLVYALSAEGWREWRDRPRQAPREVRLVELTDDNEWAHRSVRTHRSQQRFVAPVAQSYGDAMFGEEDGRRVAAVLRGIEADGERAGFVMWTDVDPAVAEPYLWRLLIDRRHQHRGIGARVMGMIVEHLREQGHRTLRTSWVQAKGGPEPFYLRLGFVPTGEYDDGEAVARLRLE